MKVSPLTQARRSFRAALMLVAAAIFVLAGAKTGNTASGEPGESSDEILVFAASSLAPPLEEIAALYQERSGVRTRFSFASSATLARQIEYGAPADLFITAHPLWLERLVEQRRMSMAEVRAIAGNRLVLVRGGGTELGASADFREILLTQGLGRIATGDPASVPLGMYARGSLQALGLWDAVSPRLAPAANARAALLLVERGLAPLGILYASDVTGSSLVEIAAEMPPGGYSPINYLAAPIGNIEPRPELRSFLSLLSSPAALEIFLQHGFAAPK